MNLSKFQKVALGVVGSLVGLGVIAGGLVLKKQHDEKVAYENRPIIEDSCVMNGYGIGSCNFTNKGKSVGSVCGSIHVYGPTPPRSPVSEEFCSGQVEPQSTVKVEFNIPAVDKACEEGFKEWTEVCEFSFVNPNKPQGTDI